MDQNFRKRLRKTLYSGELEAEHNPLALTGLAVEYFRDLAPHKLGHIDLHSASTIGSQETVSSSSVVMSMIYAKRLQRKRPDYIRKMSSSDLFIISMMMASKYLYDEGVDEEVFNDEWADNAGMEKDEVNKMEMDFLDAIDWGLFINKDEFDQALLSVERSIALKEGMKRGWFSYMDLCLLLDDPRMQISLSNVSLEWFKVVLVSTTAYVAGIMTMVGSTVLVTHTPLLLASCGLAPAAHLSPQSSLPPLPLPQFSALQQAPDEVQGNHSSPAPLSDMQEEEEQGKAAPKPAAWNPGKAVVDTILSQLMAVLTLKSHLGQFVSAVSDGLASSSASRHNKSRSNLSCFAPEAGDIPAQESEPDDADMVSVPDAVMSLWLRLKESPTDFGCAVCSRCRKKNRSGGGRLVDSQFGPHEPQTPLQKMRLDWEESLWRKDRFSGTGKQLSCHEGLGCDVHSLLMENSCLEEGMANMQNVFPDIRIGFTTSQPPLVYAT